MDIYLAGENGKTRILAEQIWGGQHESIPRRRIYGQPLGRLETDGAANRGGQNEHLPRWGASREERETCTRGGQKILESFFACRDTSWITKLIPYLGGFLLDSGAFTFMQGTATANWDEYTEEYADFIVRHKIDLFFELDIDPIVGLREVERLRVKLERLTGRQPIPVWHKSRGLEYFTKMCKEYGYVAVGGIVSKEIPREKYEAAFPYFIKTAHTHGAKIHGLGYTSFEGIKKYHFDSVDSTAWLYGNRGGYLYKFDHASGDMKKIPAPPGHRLASQDAARWNFNEWIKYQKYAEKFL